MKDNLDQEAGTKVIKRYANRKLYDTEDSRYITLEEIGQMIREGVDLKIVDNRSKGDMTTVTLAQIIFEEEKKKTHMPLGVLRGIIRSGGETLSGFIQNELTPRVSSLRDGAEAGLKLLRRDGTTNGARELPTAASPVLTDWQRRVDDSLRQAIDTLTAIPSLGREIQALGSRLDGLRARMERLEQQDRSRDHTAGKSR